MSRLVPLLAILLLATPVLAGCLTPQPVEAASTDAPVATPPPSFLRVHTAEGLTDLGDLRPLSGEVLPVGVSAFEPTVGVDPEGNLYYAATAGGVAIGYKPLVMKSSDGGATWTDVSPRVGPVSLPPETNDPFLYVDPDNGRVFQFAMAPILTCSVLSWSDNGGQSWTTNPKGCGTSAPWDHQSMVTAKSRGTPTVGYDKVVHQCVNQLLTAWCSRSLDGGLTFSPGKPVFANECGGLHGHPAASPDGIVYLPKDECGKPYVGISRDDGLTWEEVKVSDVASQGWSDPAVAVDKAGNVYYLYETPEGGLLLSVSRDAGKTWSEPLSVSPAGVTTHLPTIAAGDEGRIVLAYPGTEDLPQGYKSPKADQDKAAWHAYVAVSVNALDETPVFQTLRATGDDPLVRGACGPDRCPGMVDFIDVAISPEGYAYASFVDACTAACATNPTGKNNSGLGILVALRDGPLLLALEQDAAEEDP